MYITSLLDMPLKCRTRRPLLYVCFIAGAHEGYGSRHHLHDELGVNLTTKRVDEDMALGLVHCDDISINLRRMAQTRKLPCEACNGGLPWSWLNRDTEPNRTPTFHPHRHDSRGHADMSR